MNIPPFFTADDMELVGLVGVDSGQLMIVDPCYVTDGATYDDICLATSPYDTVAGGFASATMHGDGGFPVYGLKDARGRLRAMLVWMDDLEDPEDEDPEDEDPEDEDEDE